MTDDTAGHIALQSARETEARHLATTQQQIAEWDLSIATREANIKKYQDGIDAERDGPRLIGGWNANYDEDDEDKLIPHDYVYTKPSSIVADALGDET